MGNYSQVGVQTIVIGQTGTYDIVAYGAQGGSNAVGNQSNKGGYGAETGGTFNLVAGERLKIIVGGQGQSPGPSNLFSGGGGGGGGSFVLASTNGGQTYSLLLAAGGGGGAGYYGAGRGGLAANDPGGFGNGQGGTGGQYHAPGGGGYNGGGGAGFKSAGSNGAYASSGSGASSITAYGSGYNSAAGGIGGGGGGGLAGGGGGGGYTGGEGGSGSNVASTSGGYGGRSYDAGTPISAKTLSAVRQGNGLVTVTAVCFCAGTLIRTTRGDVAVEDLRVGDLAVTASGEQRAIRWTGHQTVKTRYHRQPAEVMPVRILAGALGENLPVRDLLVSPGHSLCLDVLGEVLIPAISLVNGTTIVQEPVESVTYWHVELDSHDVLLAEGQPAESYLEMGNRGFFADGVLLLLGSVPDADAAARTYADFCRPYHGAGIMVEAARARIEAHAARAGRQSVAVAA